MVDWLDGTARTDQDGSITGLERDGQPSKAPSTPVDPDTFVDKGRT